MKVLTFSRYFPKGHTKAGEPTHFVEKIWACHNISITHAGWDLPEMKVFSPLNFLDHPKHHTIRASHRWKPGDMASLRVWSGAPYRSKQIEFAQVKVNKVWNIEIGEFWFINDAILEHEKVEQLAKNDGLAYDDFINWFKIHPKKSGEVFNGQVICWSDKIVY